MSGRTSYRAPALDGRDRFDIVAWDSTNAEVVAIGGTSAQSSELSIGVYRIVSSSNAWFTTGANPTASAASGSAYLAAGVPEYLFLTTAGKIAVIQDSAAGNLSICPALEA